MESIIRELYYGNINPHIGSFERNTQYSKAMHIIADNEEKLLASLEEANKSLFEEYVKAEREIECLTALEKFIHGFKLAVMIMIEVFTGPDIFTTHYE